jgi:hypothetical protein
MRMTMRQEMDCWVDGMGKVRDGLAASSMSAMAPIQVLVAATPVSALPMLRAESRPLPISGAAIVPGPRISMIAQPIL